MTPIQPRRERLSPASDCAVGQHLLDEHIFKGALVRERKRADRSNEPLMLLLVTLDSADSRAASQSLAAAVLAAKADTHIAGWFEGRKTIGLIAPEVQTAVHASARDLQNRVRRELECRLGNQALAHVSIHLHAHRHSSAEASEALPPVDPLITRVRRMTVYDCLKR